MGDREAKPTVPELLYFKSQAQALTSSSSGRESPDSTSMDEPRGDRKRTRREKNRQAAAKCRQRRRDAIETLEKQGAEQLAENAALLMRINETLAQIATIKKALERHKCRM